MSRATIRHLFTAQGSPLVTADDFLRGTGRRILTAWHSVPVISDGLMLAAVASFARQAPRASGPPVNLLAAALATPLSRTQTPLRPATGFSARQPPHTCPPVTMPAAVLPPPSTRLHSSSRSAGTPLPHSGGCSLGTSPPRFSGRCSHQDCSSPGLPC